jgi:hypothetical protein
VAGAAVVQAVGAGAAAERGWQGAQAAAERGWVLEAAGRGSQVVAEVAGGEGWVQAVAAGAWGAAAVHVAALLTATDQVVMVTPLVLVQAAVMGWQHGAATAAAATAS